MSNKEDKKEEAVTEGRCIGTIKIFSDPIDDSLEELSAISEAWQKNRDRNKASPILRRAMISAAQEVVDNVELYLKQQADIEKKNRAE